MTLACKSISLAGNGEIAVFEKLCTEIRSLIAYRQVNADSELLAY